MTDPNHPIFKQFPELDPSTIVIRDTPHPDWVWNQPPIMGTLTPGYSPYPHEQPSMPGRDQHWAPPTGGSQAQPRPQRWQPDFPGLWDDVPGSGTTPTIICLPLVWDVRVGRVDAPTTRPDAKVEQDMEMGMEEELGRIIIDSDHIGHGH
ncbi:unnamed protein product [Rhizoctonia solani]|uniref:Uncharacterized protein n=1 Tax=Rhizoctonia solani TaxID=456999 RepID=A0A8H3DV37_9AGAM|nr:unnamed protein product [Rhizoctonia solani]